MSERKGRSIEETPEETAAFKMQREHQETGQKLKGYLQVKHIPQAGRKTRLLRKVRRSS